MTPLGEPNELTSQASGYSEALIHRAFSVMDAVLSNSDPMSLTEIVSATQLPKSSVYRLLKILTSQKLLRRTGRLYAPGEQGLRFSAGVQRFLPPRLAHTLLPFAVRLHHVTGFVSYLCVPTHHELLVAEVVFDPAQESLAPLRGTRLPAHCTAAGKIFMAYDSAYLERVLDHPLVALTRHSVTDPIVISNQIRQVRRAGLATAAGERLLGVLEQAVPVHGGHRRPVAGLTLAIPGPCAPNPAVTQILRQVAREGSLAARRSIRG
ncbi:IclR family transcriptional regulator [Micromonospora sp. LOL_025]|uniref:IclR family transcriptional regulator n=1 Tax=Micromonospora sp. LOL_025 TaxID=3345413 RepID=UPI003A8A2EE3